MRTRTLGLLAALLFVSSTAALAQPLIVLYADLDFRGERIGFEGSNSSLDSVRWNDRASSIEVVRGSWEVCKDPGFRGCQVIFDGGPGKDRDLSRTGWNDRISSLRPVPGGTNSGNAPSADQPVRQEPEQFRIAGRGVLALEGQQDDWFNNAVLNLRADGSFHLNVSTRRSQTFTGTYRWVSQDQVDLVITDGPGRGQGTAYLDRGNLHSIEIIGTFRGTGIYTFSFINQVYAPWNQ